MQPDGAANIYQVPPAIYKSSCDINVEYFPFDEQECEMKFGSWTFEADQLNFTYYKFYGLDMTDYLKSGTWDIVDCPARIVICTDPETKRRISMYIAKFIIRRKTLFYTVNLIIPCMLISFVSICVFMLPADAGEKITLIISILLALVVFLLLISKLLPPSKTIPLIAKYLLFTFIMNIIAIGSTVFIINRNYRTPRTHRMPEWVRIVFLKYLPKFLFMTRPNHDERWKSPLKVHSEENLDHDIKRHANHDMSNTRSRNCRLHNVPEATEVGYTPMSPELIEATEAIGFITEHLKWEDRYGSVRFIDLFYNDNVVNTEKYTKTDSDVYESLTLFMQLFVINFNILTWYGMHWTKYFVG